MRHADRVNAPVGGIEDEAVLGPVAVTKAAVAAGVVLALVLLGPVLGRGSLVNLDMVAIDHWPFPRSFWGIGPELPRLGPLEVVLSGLAALSSGATAVKLLLMGSLVGAYVGMARLVAALAARPGAIRVSDREVHFAAHAAALLYAASPYLLTRAAVGHLSMVAAYALLAFTVTTLLRPSRDLSMTTLALLAHAVLGFYGALIAGVCLVSGLAAEWRLGARPRLFAVAGSLLVTQLLWLPASLAVLRDGTALESSEVFTRGVADVFDAVEVLAGLGFWQPILQVGGSGGPEVVVAAVVLAGLAAVGRRFSGDRSWDVPGTWCAVGAVAVIWAMSWSPVFEVVAAVPGGAALREPHRLLPLYLVWLAPAAPMGAVMVARRLAPWGRTSVVLTPVMAALVLAAPGFWGIHERLEPVVLPAGWSEARDLIAADPGTVLVLPWHRYLDVAAADGRRALNPAIRFFGPDVVVANDLGVAFSAGSETADRRNAVIETLLPSMRAGDPVADALADAGITWVAVTHDADYLQYLPILGDPGLESVLADVSIDVLRVRDGWGFARSIETGAPLTAQRWGPVVRFGTSGSVEWSAASAAGWHRNGAAMGTDRGVVMVPDGDGPMFHWPVFVILGGHLAALGSGFLALRGQMGSGRRRSRPGAHTRLR